MKLYLDFMQNDKSILQKIIAAQDENGKLVGVCQMKYSNNDNSDGNFNTGGISIGTKWKLLLSFAVSQCLSELTDGECMIDCLSVDREFRGQGIGQILLDAAEKEAKKKGYTKISLLVILKNFGARRLYEKWGYVTTKLFTARPIFLFGSHGMYKMEKEIL
ncbi:DgyrCDS14736 [Dimorphilus gyrociliatus]|uniref:DgyrCDS14736 n=1 Tax=Dimorphilus gyrociliatus TaxID=2664684 RepID=A0A7I8WEM1_9ANNE|nr:DgyrCDS14736 [Dimorphilus gyrociliatus]